MLYDSFVASPPIDKLNVANRHVLFTKRNFNSKWFYDGEREKLWRFYCEWFILIRVCITMALPDIIRRNLFFFLAHVKVLNTYFKNTLTLRLH